jgi:hypothetical protein
MSYFLWLNHGLRRSSKGYLRQNVMNLGLGCNLFKICFHIDTSHIKWGKGSMRTRRDCTHQNLDTCLDIHLIFYLRHSQRRLLEFWFEYNGSGILRVRCAISLEFNFLIRNLCRKLLGSRAMRRFCSFAAKSIWMVNWKFSSLYLCVLFIILLRSTN